MRAVPHCYWHASKRYNYWAVDLYYYPLEYNDVSADPSKFMHESWFEHAKGAIFAGTRKEAEKVAHLMNDAYWRGIDTAVIAEIKETDKRYPF